jgi:excisionase family DNA binding protein
VTELVSIRQAADTLGVHYMTAYRYVRTGRLPAERAGSEWRIDRADLRRFRESPAVPSGRPSRPARSTTRARLEARLLAADEPGAWAVVESALAAGATPAAVHLELLGPVLVDLGDQWAAGSLTIADEHRASTVAHRVVGRLGPQFVRPGRRRGTVLVGAVADEHHSLPGAMLADLLRGAGFVAVDLGANTPPHTFVDEARATPQLVAVGLGAFTAARRSTVAATVADLRGAGIPAPILVGGRAIPSAEVARALGADGWTGPDGATAVDAFRAVVGAGASRHSREGGVQ